ncbi:MAG: sigma 54-interacting transcriptional regulator [Burkholderiales bacterium]
MKKPQERVSLADVAEHAGRPLRRASSDTLAAGVPPTLEDLAESLFFSPGDGRIWLNDQRMVLLHTASIGALRRELIETLGTEKARGLLTRIGYTSGARDAEVIRRRWPDGDLASAFNAGPRLHSLEGVVKVTPVHFEFDVDRGSFMGEFLWHDSMEAAEHVAAYGIGSSPACWMQIGYASGYASAFLGKLIVYREIQCAAMGAPCCRILGKPADEWQDIEDDLRYFKVAEIPGKRPKKKTLETASMAATKLTAGSEDQRTMVGLSPAFRAARHMLERVARSSATVLFTGESGVGKELFSHALHAISPRASGPFIAINCAAIPETLLEAELFGVEKGAFTGAIASRSGRFERASGGTLFLDEVSSMSLVAQGKLLRALQEGEIERVGGARSIEVDVRVVAASNVDLRQEVRARRFRDDLFFRLNVFPIELPPLRDRRDDIPLLMEHFLAQYSTRHQRKITGFTRRAVEALLNYDYPGNVRELQNLIERGVIYAEDGDAIDVVHIFRSNELMHVGAFSLGQEGALRASESPAANRKADTARTSAAGEKGVAAVALDAGLSLKNLEDGLFKEALARSNGNVSGAARLLGMSRAQLDYRLSK